MRVDGAPAHQRVFELAAQAMAIAQRREHPFRCTHDLGADAVTREKEDFVSHDRGRT